MLRAAILKIFASFLTLYAVALSPALVVDGYLDSPMGMLLLAPWLTIYLLDVLGMPGMLVNDGQCGWGWCSPTPLGWLLAAALWLLLLWLLAWTLVVLASRVLGRKPTN